MIVWRTRGDYRTARGVLEAIIAFSAMHTYYEQLLQVKQICLCLTGFTSLCLDAYVFLWDVKPYSTQLLPGLWLSQLGTDCPLPRISCFYQVWGVTLSMVAIVLLFSTWCCYTSVIYQFRDSLFILAHFGVLCLCPGAQIRPAFEHYHCGRGSHWSRWKDHNSGLRQKRKLS